MFAFYDHRFRDILLLTLGFLGAVWFFIDLDNHHPIATLNLPADELEIIDAADSVFYSWQYQPLSLKKRAVVTSTDHWIDYLQRTRGSDSVISALENEGLSKVPVFYWEVEEFRINDSDRETLFTFRMSKDGEVISFDASDELIREQTPFNRPAVRFAYLQGKPVPRAVEDSLISALVNFQHLRSERTTYFNIDADVVASTQQEQVIWRGVDYYLKGTFWGDKTLSKDSLEFNDDGNVRYITAYLSVQDSLMGIHPKISMQLMPAGVVKNISVDFGEVNGPDVSAFFIRSNLILGFGLFLVVWVLLSFYLRIKARAVDTKPALIVAIIAGFMVPVLRILELAKSLGVNPQMMEVSQLFTGILGLSMAGALVASAFFVVTSVSDSVTRQYWPEQMRTWDLVRRGMFKNKPIGWAIIRGICIGAFLAGVTVLLFNVLPVYISGEVNFSADRFVLAPLANIIITMLIGVGFVVVSLLTVGNQLYARFSKKWIIPFVSAFLFALVIPATFMMAPTLEATLVNFLIGFFIGVFYIYFDFVTVALGMVVYLNFVATASGWLVEGSPDYAIFVGFIITLTIVAFTAMYFVIIGEDKDQLPEYVPDYIEDLAKAQRVKQELDIARSVQVAFLPNTTPDVTGFDTSAICEPAQDTGGDYYDIICLDDHRAAIAIGDVSGKGIQAAFYMTFAKGVIHSLSGIFPSPKTMLYRANLLFNQNATRGTFISMIYGVLDARKRTFSFTRAGHNPILYKKADGSVEWLKPKGVALGMTKGEMFNKVMEEQTLELKEGDVLVLYTDGITEAQNENGEFYDEERLRKVVKRVKKGTAQDLRNLIIEDVRTFIGDEPQYDDMTLVVIKA